jgi:RHS repeat-associated protein
VTALVNAADGTESARYEFGPFGEPLRITGAMGKVNPIRFSTQFADDWTGDLKYLFRDYRPDLGRWPNRDPLGEEGGINLYGFVRNHPINVVDADGLAEFPRLPTVPSFPTIPTIPSFPWPHPLPPPTRPPIVPPSLPSLPQISLPSLCLFNPFRAGGVNFVGFNQAALNDFRVIPESGTTMGAPSTGWNSNVDGFWWRNSRQWFKIPDHCHCTITAAPTAGMPSAFTAECCCNACIHGGLTAYRDWKNDPRPTRPGFYPDTPPTNHGTDYPFENEQ